MKLSSQSFLLLVLFIGIAVGLAACSNDGEFVAVNTDPDGVAIRGFDAVAYFAVDSAVQGNGAYEYVWNGARWLFANAENLERFRQDPEAYAPQYGGYCSYAVSKGYTADGDPNAWKVVDGKLFLNYSPDVKKIWEKEESNNITKATKNWKEFRSKKPEHKG